MGEIVKKSNICIIGVLEAKERNWTEAIIEEIMTENFQNCWKTSTPASRSLSNPKQKIQRKPYLGYPSQTVENQRLKGKS